MPKTGWRCLIATLPTGTKAELNADSGHQDTPTPVVAAKAAVVGGGAPVTLVTLRGFRGRLLRALVDDLIDNPKVPGHLGGKELVAFQRVLDRLVSLPGVLDVDLVEPLLEVQDFLRVQHDVGGLALKAAGGLVHHDPRIRQ